MRAIEIEHASKTIKGRTVLNDVTVTLDEGGVYGFFGINGSGKSMLFRAISGLIGLDSGTISVFGKRIGVDTPFPDDMGLALGAGFWEDYSGLDNLLMLASIQGKVGEREARAAIAKLGLDPDDKRPYKSYSLGMRQRLELAQAVMERPRLLILDEPTNALDASGLQLVVEIIGEERARGATILLTAHNVPELEELCGRTFEMYEGSLRETGAQ